MRSVPPSPTIEIIEIIDDDEGGDWSSRPTTRAAGPDAGRRWIGPVAAGALVVIIGYGVISSAISSHAANTKQPPTSLPRTSTDNSSVDTARPVQLISPQFYLADPAPSGFNMLFAETLGMGGNSAEFTDSTTAELWATDGATATSGSWFVVSRGTHHSTGRNAYRAVTGDVEVVVEHDPLSGQKVLSFTKDGNNLEITAFGWADRQLLHLVDSIYIDQSAIQFHDLFFTSDHKRLLNADPPNALYGLPVAWVGYTTAVPTSLAENFIITVAGYPTTDDRGMAVRFAVADPSTITVGGLPGMAGRSAADPRLSIVQWRDGDRLITMRGNLDPARLYAIAQTVHQGSDDSAKQQVDAGAQSMPQALDGGPRHIVAAGLPSEPWTVEVSASAALGADPGYVWWIGQWWIGQQGDSVAPTEARVSLADPGPSIETLVEHGTTYVLVKVPRSMDGAKLHVNPNGLPSVEVNVIDVDATLNDEFAAYAFTAAVPFTAEIVDSSGVTVAAWPET